MAQLVLVLLLAFLLPRQIEAKDFLWRVKTPTSTLYLLGSVHALSAMDYPLGSSYESAYNAAQQVAFEINLDDATTPSMQSYILSKGVYSDGTTIGSVLPATTYQKLQNFAAAHGQSVNFFDPYRPWLASLLVSDFLIGDAGFNASYGVDQHFFNAAKAAGKSRIYLETATSQIDTLAAVSEAEIIAGFPAAIDQGKQDLIEIVSAWRTGNSDGLGKEIDALRVRSPEQYRLVFLKRNTNFLAHAENFLKQNKTTLMIVGAGHMVGSDGVVKGLVSRGYSVLQLPGTAPTVSPLILDYAAVPGESILFSPSTTPVLAEGASFKMIASASGDGPLTLQWLKDGLSLSGETNAVLSRTTLKSTDSGSYQLRVQSEFGTATSSPFSVTVTPVIPPHLHLRRSRSGMLLTLSGTTNAHYRVEFAEQLPGPWTSFTNLTLLLQNQGILTASPAQRRFFRMASGAQ